MANGSIAVRVDVLNMEPVKKLHEAVCQAVALLNLAPELARSTEGREAHDLLRQALQRHYSEDEIHPLVRAHDAHMAALDCRTCRHYTQKTGGCMSVVRCVQGCAYQRAGVQAYWSDQ